MAFSQTDLDAIDRAIASGVLRVEFADRRVEYQSMADLLRARAAIAGAVTQSSGTPMVRQIRPIANNGW